MNRFIVSTIALMAAGCISSIRPPASAEEAVCNQTAAMAVAEVCTFTAMAQKDLEKRAAVAAACDVLVNTQAHICVHVKEFFP